VQREWKGGDSCRIGNRRAFNIVTCKSVWYMCHNVKTSPTELNLLNSSSTVLKKFYSALNSMFSQPRKLIL